VLGILKRMLRELPMSFYVAFLLMLVAANIFFYRALFAPHVLTVSVLDVGKGSAALVKSPAGKSLLIDAGPDASILRALGDTLPMWQRGIDAVILTGTKSAFVGGLPEVESRYRIGTITHIGDANSPYGSAFSFDSAHIEIISPGSFVVSYGGNSFKISSTTPKGIIKMGAP
jgi:beta-lactamase superfamily II metal-dependent hydrolase